MAVPICRECEYCKNLGRWKRFTVGFKCDHPEAPEWVDSGDPAFLGQSEKRTEDIKMKTSPRWCPRKKKGSGK